MRLLIDENVPDAVTEYFRLRGHEVIAARDIVAAGSPDPLIARIGADLEALIVTWNRRDFVAAMPIGTRATFRKLGLITFTCREPNGRARAEALIDLIEFAYQNRPLRERFWIEIGESYVKIHR